MKITKKETSGSSTKLVLPKRARTGSGSKLVDDKTASTSSPTLLDSTVVNENSSTKDCVTQQRNTFVASGSFSSLTTLDPNTPISNLKQLYSMDSSDNIKIDVGDTDYINEKPKYPSRKQTSLIIAVLVAVVLLSILAVAMTYLVTWQSGGFLTAPPQALFDALQTANIKADIKFLSSDLLEGRAPGTRGEQLACEYIASQYQIAGLEEVAERGSSYFQKVPLVGLTPSAIGKFTIGKNESASVEMEFGVDFVSSSDLAQPRVDLSEDSFIFVGYGISAPEWQWDDFKDVDVKGKILLSFVNEPTLKEDPALFKGEELTYYGRWMYKQEEARRKGALGLVLIHTLQTAGYPFAVITNGGQRENVQLSRPVASPLETRSWISEEKAEQIANLGGESLKDWFAKASKRDFRPVVLPYKFKMDMSYQVRNFNGINTIGKLQGASNETIIFTAHHDHLGIGVEDANGDNIYNGALDNAAGVATMLTIMRSITSSASFTDYQRSFIFLTTTAEEAGLLGSQYYAENPEVPVSDLLAVINFDGGNVFGPTNDVVGIGSNESDLGLLLSQASSAEKMYVSPDPEPAQGLMFRSDQLSFARVGIPAIKVTYGCDFVGKPPGYCAEIETNYNLQHYHQPSDEFSESWTYDGMIQTTRVALRLGYGIAQSKLAPAYYTNSPFSKTQAKRNRNRRFKKPTK